MKFRIMMQRCKKCDGWHSHFWATSSTPPPSCAERQRRAAGANTPAWSGQFKELG